MTIYFHPTRGAPVEPERKLLQVGLEMLGCHRPLVGAEDPSFRWVYPHFERSL